MNNMMAVIAHNLFHITPDLAGSRLYDENGFYRKFLDDLKRSRREVIIESPFMTTDRTGSLIPAFQKLVDRKVKVYVVTRDPEEHDLGMKMQAEKAIRRLESMGIQVIITTGYHHRKLAILDRSILWEGSLNILSHSCSREIMRRIISTGMSDEMFRYLRLDKFIY